MSTQQIVEGNKVIAWWSGGITSAVTCKLCIDWYGVENVRVVFIDTKNEDEDTYRFKSDCEKWYGKQIEVITNEKYSSIEEVWFKFLSLNVATGAICSTELKRAMREKFQRENEYDKQAFGFEIDEPNRARAMKKNYKNSRPTFPLIYELLTKDECRAIVKKAGIEPPSTYKYGFQNNNCFKTGCVQGGIGYWQKMQREFPDKFEKMAKVEHDLTDLKGQPVTMLKDQSKSGGLVFLKPHPMYPFTKDISMMKGREPKPLKECNGYCGINDLSERNPTENEINYSVQ
jgi:3'-phosphoadenosine 5'-phosphosulfate sulfotransferase (PAPS reductase)/FAD synthetase